jgi:hypothetical protein
MDILSELHGRAKALTARLGADTVDAELAPRIVELDDAELMAVLSDASALGKAVERLRVLATGAVARRSKREEGQGGLAQKRGHRTTVALVQDLQGSSRTEAVKQVRVAEAMLDGVLAGSADGSFPPSGGAGEDAGREEVPEGAVASSRLVPWHEPVDRGLLEGRVSATQADAIRRGLGEPPARHGEGDTEGMATAAECEAEAIEVWRLAAEQLVAEARSCTVEDLAAAARYLRDELDPKGAEERYLRRHEARAFRMWNDGDGVTHGRFTFDDEGAAWMRSMIDAALRPRRGGPRFVDSEEAERAKKLVDDPRTNDQLAYDLLIDLVKAGTTATVEQVFSTRLAGVRLVRIVPSGAGEGGESDGGVGHVEDGGAPVPVAAIDQAICQSGTVAVTVDEAGNPLDVGRDQRLFTPRQRIALAIRDGGCLWPGCDRPASSCESHHIDPWSQGGRTDVDRGALVCRFPHMNLRHHGWRIRRAGKGGFLLHPPDGSPPTVLRSRSPLRWHRAIPDDATAALARRPAARSRRRGHPMTTSSARSPGSRARLATVEADAHGEALGGETRDGPVADLRW